MTYILCIYATMRVSVRFCWAKVTLHMQLSQFLTDIGITIHAKATNLKECYYGFLYAIAMAWSYLMMPF